MNHNEAADVIDEIIKSIKANPAQFHLSVKVTGQQVTSYGGTGMSVSVVGGGAGSTTIGNKVSFSGGAVEIAQQRGLQAVDEQFNALLVSLDQLSRELRVQDPDKSLVKRLVASLKDTWVPGVICGVVGNVVSKALGV